MQDLKIGSVSLREWVPLLGRAMNSVTTEVVFEGPTLTSFKTTTPLFAIQILLTQLPVEPFVIQAESHFFGPWWLPAWVVEVYANASYNLMEQDRRVWENKVYNKMMLVPGDGSFPAFRRWFALFYSEGSKKAGERKESLEW